MPLYCLLDVQGASAECFPVVLLDFNNRGCLFSSRQVMLIRSFPIRLAQAGHKPDNSDEF
jgi:hypothetical protein